MYATFAKEAKEEGFDHIAYLFEEVGKIEKEHEQRYLKLLENVEGGLVFSRDGDMIWQCANCGHIHVGKEAPEICPVCAHPRAYFQLQAKKLLILLQAAIVPCALWQPAVLKKKRGRIKNLLRFFLNNIAACD